MEIHNVPVPPCDHIYEADLCIYCRGKKPLTDEAEPGDKCGPHATYCLRCKADISWECERKHHELNLCNRCDPNEKS